MKTDLHFHSIYSDGEETLEELKTNYKKLGFGLLSLTDHNCIESSIKFKKMLADSRIQAIVGAEISSSFQGLHIHLVAYGYSLEIRPLIKEIQDTRIEETKEKIKKLNDLGLKISYDELKNLFPKTKYWGNKHLIDLLKIDEDNKKLLKKYSPSNDLWSLINNVFNPGKPAYVESKYLDSVEIIKRAKKAGSFVSLAHPGQHLERKDDSLIKKLAKKGLDGIEAVSLQHNWDQIAHYQMLAESLGLEITAGTDYHGQVHIENGVHDPREIWNTPDRLSSNISKLMSRNKTKNGQDKVK